jgi:uncharacterized protein (DUF169 family)
MDMEMKMKFERLWKKYFNGAELPLVFFYRNDKPPRTEMPKPTADHRCLVGDLAKARRGKGVALNAQVIGCSGGMRYLGFSDMLMPEFEYFLSYGIPGKLEGERYKKSPELVRETVKRLPRFTAPGRFIVFKRWDRLEESDYPVVAIFFATPDVLSGLFTLACFDEADQNAVFAPFGSGCSTIVQYPYLEKESERPRAVLGMFDVSSRPCVPADVITLAVPMKKFVRMIENMEESFLITGSWRKVKRRISIASRPEK